MLKRMYDFLYLPEITGKQIGFFRIVCAILGGLVNAYLGMTLLALILPFPIEQTAIISLMLNTFVWAIMGIYIVFSDTKFIALLRVFIPFCMFALALLFLY